ncbi:MAG: heavy metal sensor histidine kinase [Proteobacteria bacterium]|nr:heavy metal sensor histidine kinase [Pseudomonadota bacterium]
MLVSLTALIIIGLFLYEDLNLSMFDFEEKYLIDEVYLIQSLLDERHGDLSAANSEINAIPHALKKASYRYYVQIFDSEGHLLKRTSTMPKSVQHLKFPLATPNWQESMMTQKAIDKKTYLLVTAPLVLNHKTQKNGTIQIALDLAYPNQLISLYHWHIALLILGVFIISALLGRLVTSRGLKPLFVLANTAENVRLDQLNQRINVSDWPQELLSVGQAFNKMLSRIENAFKRLNKSTSELAHELRTPVASLMLEAEVARTRPRDIAYYEKLVDSSLEELKRLTEIMNGVLFLANTNHSETCLNLSKIEVMSELKNILNLYSALAKEKNIELNLSGISCFLTADTVLFHRVISNLLANAINYTPNGGKVSISLSIKQDRSIQINISDTGIGIPKEYHEQIFEDFFRAPNAKTFYEQGSGLGLPIVKQIMELHGGSIQIESVEKQGATVQLVFPNIS